MKLHWTKVRPDGRKSWGLLKILTVGTVVGLAGWWSVSRMQRAPNAATLVGPPKRAANPAAASVRISAIAKSAQATQPYTEKAAKPEALAQSQVGMRIDDPVVGSDKAGRTPVVSENPAKEAMTLGEDSVFSALTRTDEPIARDGRPDITGDNVGGLGSASKDAMPPNGSGSPGRLLKPMPVPSIESLVAHPEANSKNIAAQRERPGKENEHIMKATHWLPRGEIVPVYIMQTVQTGRFPTLVEFAVAKTVWFNGKPVLPFGTRFTATAGLGVRDRITFNVDSLRRRDGLAIALGGLVLGPDQATGLPGYYIPPPTLVQLAPYIGNFFQSYADLLKLRVTRNSYQVGSFGLSITPDPGANEAQELALSAASQALGDFIGSQVSELKERYAAYLAVPAGSAAFVQLTGNTDFSALWDNAPRGQARTVGEPRIVATDLLYRQRELERASQPSLAALIGQTANSGVLPAVLSNAARTPSQPAPINATRDDSTDSSPH